MATTTTAGTFTATCKLYDRSTHKTQWRDIAAHDHEATNQDGQSARTFTDRAEYAAHMKLHGARPARGSGPPANNGGRWLRVATSRQSHDPAVDEVGSWVTLPSGGMGQVWATGSSHMGSGYVIVADGTTYHHVYKGHLQAAVVAEQPELVTVPVPETETETETVTPEPVVTVTLEPAAESYVARRQARKAHNRGVLAPMLDEIRDGWRGATNRADIWAAAKAGADTIPAVAGGDGGRQSDELTDADRRFMADHVQVIAVG